MYAQARKADGGVGGDNEGLYFAAQNLEFGVTATSHGICGRKSVGGVVDVVAVAVLYICQCQCQCQPAAYRDS